MAFLAKLPCWLTWHCDHVLSTRQGLVREGKPFCTRKVKGTITTYECCRCERKREG